MKHKLIVNTDIDFVDRKEISQDDMVIAIPKDMNEPILTVVYSVVVGDWIAHEPWENNTYHQKPTFIELVEVLKDYKLYRIER